MSFTYDHCQSLMTDEHFWTDGALDADLVVIDDPQRASIS